MRVGVIKILMSLVALGISSQSFGQCYIFGSVDGSDIGVRGIETADGGYAIVGYTGSFGTFQGSDIYVLKVDTTGNIQWTSVIEDTITVDFAYSIIEHSGGGFVLTGTFTYGLDKYLFVAKLDPNGNIVWEHVLGGNGSSFIGRSVVETATGDIVVLGSARVNAGLGGWDLFLLKLSPDGTILSNSIIGTPDGEYGYQIISSNDGGFIVVGVIDSVDNNLNVNKNILIVKLDASFNLTWSRLIGAGGHEYGYGVVQTDDGSIFIVGSVRASYALGLNDALIIKLDNNGNVLWAKAIGGNGSDIAENVIQTFDGNIVVVGYTTSFGQGSWDGYLLKLNPQGDVMWTRTIGGGNDERLFSVIQNQKGELVVTGLSRTFGLVSDDVFLAVLNSSGLLGTSDCACKVDSGGTVYPVTTYIDSGVSVLFLPALDTIAFDGTVFSGGQSQDVCSGASGNNPSSVALVEEDLAGRVIKIYSNGKIEAYLEKGDLLALTDILGRTVATYKATYSGWHSISETGYTGTYFITVYNNNQKALIMKFATVTH